jgi:hypothetical protein
MSASTWWPSPADGSLTSSSFASFRWFHLGGRSAARPALPGCAGRAADGIGASPHLPLPVDRKPADRERARDCRQRRQPARARPAARRRWRSCWSWGGSSQSRGRSEPAPVAGALPGLQTGPVPWSADLAARLRAIARRRAGRDPLASSQPEAANGGWCPESLVDCRVDGSVNGHGNPYPGPSPGTQAARARTRRRAVLRATQPGRYAAAIANACLRLRQLAELRGRVTEAIPRAALVFLTPAVTVEQPPAPTPWDLDYWLRRFPDHEQA